MPFRKRESTGIWKSTRSRCLLESPLCKTEYPVTRIQAETAHRESLEVLGGDTCFMKERTAPDSNSAHLGILVTCFNAHNASGCNAFSFTVYTGRPFYTGQTVQLILNTIQCPGLRFLCYSLRLNPNKGFVPQKLHFVSLEQLVSNVRDNEIQECAT